MLTAQTALKLWLSGIILGTALLCPLTASAQAPSRMRAKAITSSAETNQTLKQPLPKPAATPQKKMSGTWDIDLEGTSFRNELKNTVTTKTEIGADISFHLTEDLNFDVSPLFKHETGSYRNVDKDTTSEIFLKRAQADLNMVKTLNHEFSLIGGVLNQRELFSILMFRKEKSFPGLRTEWKGQGALLTGSFTAQTSVVTAKALSPQTRDFEKTPTFNTAGASIGTNGRRLKTNLRVSYFQFNDLPMSVANDSALSGNTTTSVNATTDNAFVYGYQGVEANSYIDWQMSHDWSYKLSGLVMQNTSAPSDMNLAYDVRSEFGYKVNNKWKLLPYYEYYYISPDAVVSAFSYYGSNRVGYWAGLGIQYSDSLKITAHAGERDVLFESPYQSRETLIELKLETLNELF